MENIRENPIIRFTHQQDPILAYQMGSLMWKSLESLPALVVNNYVSVSPKNQKIIAALIGSIESLATIQERLEAAFQVTNSGLKVWDANLNRNLLQILDAYQSLPGALLFFGPAAQRVKSDALTYQTRVRILDPNRPEWDNPELNAALKNLAVSGMQLRESLQTLGKFDAIHDRNLFFREGVANFEYLPVIAGLVGDYLSQNGADSISRLKMWCS